MSRRNRRKGDLNLKAQQPTKPSPVAPHGQLEVTEKHFSGPLPHPDMMKEYEAAHPGTADRILTMAEEESQHRHSIETTILSQEHEQTMKSQRNALFIAIMGLACAPLIIYITSDLIVEILGSVLGGIPVLGIIFSFIVRFRRDKNNDDDDDEE